MKTPISLAILAAALAAQSPAASAQGRTSLVGVGTLGGSESSALGINASGEVTGFSYIAGDAAQHAFLYSGGSMLDLGTLSGETESFGFAINDRGEVTGRTGNLRAFVYSAGTMRDIGTLGGLFSGGGGRSINASGHVTGDSLIAGNAATHAFLYTGSAMRDLGTLGGSSSRGRGINASGQVTGTSFIAGDGAQRAFLYSGGIMRDLGTLGGPNSFGSAINARGQVTGAAQLPTAFNPEHAFLYSDGVMQDLGTLPGGFRSFGNALNDSGQVVGDGNRSDGAFVGFLWAGGRMFELNSVAPAGWFLGNAFGINNNLQITGIGANGTRNEGFLLTLHPDWEGGSGAWSDGGRWNFGGFGAMGTTPGEPHDVLIHPAGSANIVGSAYATVNSLIVAGNGGQMVTLQLNGGSIAAANGTTLQANAALEGGGLLAGALDIRSGARVNVGAGESTRLGGAVSNQGAIRVLGASAAPASLEAGGTMTNNAGAQINLQNANASFLGGLTNSGQVNTTFGVANVSGNIDNLAAGKIIVSNGAQASFFDAVTNNGELRVSAGGAANFFGLVSGAGTFTGAGQSRYEAGFAPGNSTAQVTVNTDTTYSASSYIEMELGGTTPGSGHDKIVFNGGVTLEGGDLLVSWYNGLAGAGGDVFDLFDWNGGVTGAFGALSLPTLGTNLAWYTGDLYEGGTISIAAIPEPETYALFLAGLGLLGFAARRRLAA